MKNISLVICMLALAACSTLRNSEGALQPVVTLDEKQKIFFTTCSGAVEDLASCYRKAAKSCTNNYEVIKKLESPVAGRRELTFKCK